MTDGRRPRRCPDCGAKVASFTAGPMMQVRCMGNGEGWDGGCGAKWRPHEMNRFAWDNFMDDRRAAVIAG